MPQPKVIKTEVIVVDHSSLNDYRDLIVTDKGGKEWKVSNKRDYLHNIFQDGWAVKLGIANYMDKDFISEASLVELPVVETQKKSTEKIEEKLSTPVPTNQASLKNRAFALSYAKDLACHDKIGIADIKRHATDFAIWLDGGD